jgi:hypothetical protein
MDDDFRNWTRAWETSKKWLADLQQIKRLDNQRLRQTL